MGWNRGFGEMEACLRRVLGEAARLHETTQCLCVAPGEVGGVETRESADLARATDYVAMTVTQVSARLIRIRVALSRMSDCRAGGRLRHLILADEA
ncbi:MAG TPA: hypothetical protein VEA69_16205 [Tepidisphaeraceae bacterium]|nr:hypothetical protein [Tepidisphaeraceae bacterium]